MGLTMIAARQFQNGILARYPDAIQQIAIFAIASSIFNFFSSSFAFIPQTANVLVNGKADSRLVQKCILCIAVTEFLLLMCIIFTPWGNQLLAFLFNLDLKNLSKVIYYLMTLTPLLFIQSFNQYFTGLLIKFEKTGLVTLLNSLYLSFMISGILLGYYFQLPIVLTLVGSQVLAKTIQFLITLLGFRKYNKLIDQDKTEHTLLKVWAFFWPVALTSTMFSFSRPILYAFVSRMPESAPIIAALRLGFDFSMIFQNMINQFRHLFITYAKDDLDGVISFMIKCTFIITVLMVTVIGSQGLYGILVYVINVPPAVALNTVEVCWVLCIVPVIIGTRNYFHGQSMLNQTTKIMGFGGICRVIATSLCALILIDSGNLNHVSASFSLVLGFAVEAIFNAAGYFIKKKSTS